MATIAKKLKVSLEYQERVRQHMSRQPSIDPTTRTIMVTGYPNVGKSSFMNKVSKADVEVEPYAFTTKSIYVGHFDYKNQRWQVVDTPGILDHSQEERNVIEMQAITALAHLHATIIYIIDISETCGYTIEKQVDQFHSIRALFTNKPIVIVLNKIDLQKYDSIDKNNREQLDTLLIDKQIKILQMSNIDDIGIFDVKATACDMQLQQRCEKKLNENKIDMIANRLVITLPKERDNKKRKPIIPEIILNKRKNEKEISDKLHREQISTHHKEYIKEIVNKTIDETINNNNNNKDIIKNKSQYDKRLEWQLEDDNWKYDIIPEIMDGKNISDYFDSDIVKKLGELEYEEEELQAAFEESGIQFINSDDELTQEQLYLIQKIREKKSIKRLENRQNVGRGISSKPIPRSKFIKNNKNIKSLQHIGIDTKDMEKHIEDLQEIKRGRKRTRDIYIKDNDSTEDTSKNIRLPSKLRRVIRDESIARSISRMRYHPSHSRSVSKRRNIPPEYTDGIKDLESKLRIQKIEDSLQSKRKGRSHDSDRHIYSMKPKHLYSGKRGMGSTDRR